MIAAEPHPLPTPVPLVRSTSGASWIGTPRKPRGCKRTVLRIYDRHGFLEYVMTTDFCNASAVDPAEL